MLGAWLNEQVELPSTGIAAARLHLIHTESNKHNSGALVSPIFSEGLCPMKRKCCLRFRNCELSFFLPV